ncbi:MAG: uncharacterized protein K0R39_4956 [Symbiobacteriaceae bacterium]|nr:uncharacterized protein [Symbiobacteriaceae bacterium]
MIIALGIVAGLLLLGFLYEQMSRMRDRRLPLPGRLIDLDGYRLHLTDEGSGGPTVMIIPGAGDCSYSWIHVRKQIARNTRVLSFDRAGMGASPDGQAPDPVLTIEELRKVLARSGAPSPYVLVGHSLGGLIARLYALKYPQDVAGIVFVDSTHEGLLQDQKFLASMKVVAFLAKVLRVLSVVGLPRLLAALGVMPMYTAERKYYAQQLSPSEYRQWLAACNRGNAGTAAGAELLSAFPMMETAAKVMSPTQFGDMPVAVLNNPSFGPDWSEKGRELASRSTRGTHQTSDRPGHSLQMPRPELVLEAIQQVVGQVREQGARVS